MAQQQYQKIISVYDGDTFRVNIDEYPPILGQNIPVRVNGVDTPEIRGKCQYEKDLAIKARDFVRDKLLNAKEIKLTNIQRGKYFRIVANVLVDDVSLEAQLLKNNLAYEYYGKRKRSWCDQFSVFRIPPLNFGNKNFALGHDISLIQKNVKHTPCLCRCIILGLWTN